MDQKYALTRYHCLIDQRFFRSREISKTENSGNHGYLEKLAPQRHN
jgi:hypothetical protein